MHPELVIAHTTLFITYLRCTMCYEVHSPLFLVPSLIQKKKTRELFLVPSLI